MFLKPKEFIDTLRNSFDGCDEVYLSGSCYHLFTILKLVFPRAECYFSISKSHVITKINNQFFDINGLVNDVESYKKLENHKNYTHETMASTLFSIYGLNVVASNNINQWTNDKDKSLIKYPDTILN